MMEVGEWDMANTEKVRLEEKQRAARKEREVEAEQLAAQGRWDYYYVLVYKGLKKSLKVLF